MSENIDAFFDIGTARLAHLRWQVQLEELIKKGKGNVKLESHAACALGGWLYNDGLKNYSHLAEIIELEKIHVQFHANAESIIKCVSTNTTENALQSFSELQTTSKDIIYLLTTIELKLMNHFIFVDSIKHPLKALKRIFSNKS